MELNALWCGVQLCFARRVSLQWSLQCFSKVFNAVCMVCVNCSGWGVFQQSAVHLCFTAVLDGGVFEQSARTIESSLHEIIGSRPGVPPRHASLHQAWKYFSNTNTNTNTKSNTNTTSNTNTFIGSRPGVPPRHASLYRAWLREEAKYLRRQNFRGQHFWSSCFAKYKSQNISPSRRVLHPRPQAN